MGAKRERDGPVVIEVGTPGRDGEEPAERPADGSWRARVARWTGSRSARWVGVAALAVLLGLGVLVAREAPSPDAPAWPTALGACRTPVPLPILQTDALATAGVATGVEVLTGPVRRVAVDSGVIVDDVDGLVIDGVVTQAVVRGGEFLVLVRRCSTDADALLIAIDETGQQRYVDGGPIDALLPDGDTIWSVHQLLNGADGWWLHDPETRAFVLLPAGFRPVSVHAGLVVGRQAVEGAELPELSLVDLSTGEPTRSLGPVASLTVADGVVLWTSGACPANPAPCSLRRLDLATGQESTSGYALPRGGRFSDGVLSHDGRLLAVELPRAEPDPRYAGDRPPADLAVLDLVAGELRIVGGVELPPAGPTATVLFSTDDQWLFVAVSEGDRTRLLAWRPGLDRALESPAVLLGPAPARPWLMLAPSAAVDPPGAADPTNVMADPPAEDSPQAGEAK